MGKKIKCKIIQNMMHIGQIVLKDEFIDVDEEDLDNLIERKFVVTVKSEILKLEAVLDEEVPELTGNPTPKMDEEEEEEDPDEEEEDIPISKKPRRGRKRK